MRRYLDWRVGRKEYGIGLAIYLAAYFAIYIWVSAILAQMALPFIWILTLAVPRLRDIGWSVWWSLGPFAAGFVAGFVNAALARATGQASPIAQVLFGLIGIGSIAFMVFLAIKAPKARAAEAFS